MSDDERMRRVWEHAKARVAAIEEISATVRDDGDDDGDEAFAKRARAGELGRDWAVLQARIDLGETTRAAIMDGTDDSVAAHTVREAAHARVAQLAETMREQASREGEPDPMAELAARREHLLERGELLRARLAALLDDPGSRR